MSAAVLIKKRKDVRGESIIFALRAVLVHACLAGDLIVIGCGFFIFISWAYFFYRSEKMSVFLSFFP